MSADSTMVAAVCEEPAAVQADVASSGGKKRAAAGAGKRSSKQPKTHGPAFTGAISQLPQGVSVIMSGAEAAEVFSKAPNPFTVVETSEGCMVAIESTTTQSIPVMGTSITVPVAIRTYSPIRPAVAAVAVATPEPSPAAAVATPEPSPAAAAAMPETSPAAAAADDDEEVVAASEEEEESASEEEEEEEESASEEDGAEKHAP